MSDFPVDAMAYATSFKAAIRAVDRHHDITELILEGLSEIASITKTTTDDTAVAAMRAVASIIASLGHGLTRSVSPDAVRAEFAKAKASLEANDQKHDAELAKRFDDGTP